MKQALQLRLGQHLTMTPQLQQAIKLLQLSTMELQQEIQSVLEANPLLEVSEEPEAPATDYNLYNNTSAPSETTASPETASPSPESAASETPGNSEDYTEINDQWDNSYEAVPSGSGSSSGEDDRDYEVSDSAGESLQDHLRWQMELTPFTPTDRRIAEAIIDAISDDGYLSTNVEEIHQTLSKELAIDPDEVTAVLHRVQNFDPPGIAARNLQESLVLQLRQLPLGTQWRTQALELVEQHFTVLAERDFPLLLRRLKIKEEQLRHVVHLIQSLNPRPGGQITAAKPEYIIPDVIVRKVRNKWKVELNPETAPKVRINPHYAQMMKHAHNSADTTYIKNHLQEARWFIKSLASRNDTLLKVARCIVDQQRGFFDYGAEAMKALVLHDVAEAVGMHESTISRVTTKKYMHTPRGIFELKYFFSSHVSTTDGGECSATAIRALIKKLITAENPGKPLSDSKLALILSDQGINVARRTVAKYREALAIPPSNERKRLT
ncbi:MAG: RNA polymerase factor sigma-54 [Gammaproteobacteria bacterium]|nr:RNA polymerase factor sigma-54 [Gammaproteobacteria bacterium]